MNNAIYIRSKTVPLQVDSSTGEEEISCEIDFETAEHNKRNRKILTDKQNRIRLTATCYLSDRSVSELVLLDYC